MGVKITSLELENVKRVRAVSLAPAESGLTVIGGGNNNGKTSVLDAIAWALGGEAFRPSEPGRRGSATPPKLHVELSNGIVVERSGKSSALKVTDPSGRKAGQQLLNSFICQLALDLPKFMESSGKEKAAALLKTIGVGDRLEELERLEREKYNERLAVGRIADQKEKYAAEQPFYPDAPEGLVSASALIKEQQEVLLRNAKNQEMRLNAKELERREAELSRKVSEAYAQAAEWDKKAHELESEYEKAVSEREAAFSACDSLEDGSTEEIERSIAGIEETNRKVRANLDKEKAEEDARQYRGQYDALTAEIEEARREKAALLEGADLPLPGLSVEDGELTYNGQQWDNMSGSDRLKVSTAIVRKVKPECSFVLVDKLEQMDAATLRDFGEWAEAEGLQVIGTRVSTGKDGECSVIIEDGYSKDAADAGSTAKGPEKEPAKDPDPGQKPKKAWQKGVF